MEELKQAFYKLGEACKDCITALCNYFQNFVNSFDDNFRTYLKVISAPNCRIKHLALHSKKARVRKKNIKRLMKG